MTAAERAELAALREQVAELEEKIEACTTVIVNAYKAEGMPLPPCLGGEMPPLPPDLSLVTRVDALERGLTAACQAAHWPAGDDVQVPRDRGGLRLIDGGS
jgi:hypothetical protein